MSACLSKSVGFSSDLKQGIVSILGSETEITIKKAASLRRTLSADMSSKKWMIQSGFSASPIKRISSSEKLAVPISDSSSSEEEEGESQSDIWASIQKNKEVEKQGNFDIWSSIVSKEKDEASNSPPYVHPLVKRSKSCLSEKSLEICTESLGSETGSDGFSLYSPSENGESEEEKEEEQGGQQRSGSDFEELRVAKYNYAGIGKKLPQQSFPPPIRSISQNDGASVRMTSRRDSGRLVLEAVSVPNQNNFLAQRCDGRLVLTFSDANPENEEEYVQFEEKMEIEEELEDEGFTAEMAAPKTLSGATNFHRLAPMVKKNPTWANKFSGKVEYSEEDDKIDPAPPLALSLPPRPPGNRNLTPPQTAVGGAAGSLNGYEFFWRPKPMVKDSGLKPNDLKNPVSAEQQWGLVPLGCKEPRRSIQLCGPHCIAT